MIYLRLQQRNIVAMHDITNHTVGTPRSDDQCLVGCVFRNHVGDRKLRRRRGEEKRGTNMVIHRQNPDIMIKKDCGVTSQREDTNR